MRRTMQTIRSFLVPRVYSGRNNYVIYWLGFELVIGKGGRN